MKCLRQILLVLICLFVAVAVWIPSMHFLFTPSVDHYFAPTGITPKARALAARHLALWTDPALRAQEINKMRGSNAEWDFMGRTFLVLSLANMSLRDPAAAPQYLTVMDAIIDETLRLEREKGMYFFLMDYARLTDFKTRPARSLFLDGEIALMLGARRLVAEREDYRPLLQQRTAAMLASLQQNPLLIAESYPDECWMFDHAMAFAALRVADVLDGTDHREFTRRWLASARQHLTDTKTGLLVSCFDLRGNVSDGPEGSTIWSVAHCLQIVDPAFAADQYTRAKKELARAVCGFGFAREWPASWRGPMDVDSGPIIPVLGVSAGSSGLAVLGAAAFNDRTYLKQLFASLNLAGFPVTHDGQLRYCASNQVGDAVLLYALTQGPLWEKVRDRGGRP
jgi:hypothetical protein